MLNYDNKSLQQLEVQLPRSADVRAISPKTIGCGAAESYEKGGKTYLRIKDLHTYAVICVKEKRRKV